MAAPLVMKSGHDQANFGRMDEQHVFHCLSAMIRQEEHYLCHDYLDNQIQHPGKGDAIDETCRSKMCDWTFHVIDATGLQRETASVAMIHLDRFLSSSSGRAKRARSSRSEYQLAAMACLYISVKIREPVEMSASIVSRISRGTYSAEEITSMEYEILTALQWRVNDPTSTQFVNFILELLPDSARSVAPTIYDHSHFQAELAVGDYVFVPHVKQSTIAVASILNSLESGSFPLHDCIQFIQVISRAFNLDMDSSLLNTVRGRLSESFAKASGCELLQCVIPIPTKNMPLKYMNAFEGSPKCVSKEPLSIW